MNLIASNRQDLYSHIVDTLLDAGDMNHPLNIILCDYPDIPSLRSLIDDPRAIAALGSPKENGEEQ